MQPIDTETIDTDAGEYVVQWHYDEGADPPYNEGLGFAFNGGSHRIDVCTGEHSDEVLSIIGSNEPYAWDSRGRAHYRYSGAGIARYLRMAYGLKGIRVVDSEYHTSAPTLDRDEHIAGIAWAPDDVPDVHDTDYPSTYTDAGIAEYRAWAEGDCFGWVVTGPDGTELEDGAVWGYYGFSNEREYTLSEARNVAESDARERIARAEWLTAEALWSANLVGAGIVGLI